MAVTEGIFYMENANTPAWEGQGPTPVGTPVPLPVAGGHAWGGGGGGGGVGQEAKNDGRRGGSGTTGRGRGVPVGWSFSEKHPPQPPLDGCPPAVSGTAPTG